MAKDVEYLLHRGTYRIKALTEKARTAMGREMGGPWQMAAEVFWDKIDPSNFERILHRLRGLGLQTEDDESEQPWNF